MQARGREGAMQSAATRDLSLRHHGEPTAYRFSTEESQEMRGDIRNR